MSKWSANLLVIGGVLLLGSLFNFHALRMMGVVLSLIFLAIGSRQWDDHGWSDMPRYKLAGAVVEVVLITNFLKMMIDLSAAFGQNAWVPVVLALIITCILCTNQIVAYLSRNHKSPR